VLYTIVRTLQNLQVFSFTRQHVPVIHGSVARPPIMATISQTRKGFIVESIVAFDGILLIKA
jgi:hypothetical protein